VSSPSLTFYLTQRNAEKFVRKLFGGKYDEMVLERLDRLTLDEARITAAQILEVVYGLVQNMRVVMDGKQTDLACHPLAIEFSFLQTARHRSTVSGMPWVCLLVTMSWFCV